MIELGERCWVPLATEQRLQVRVNGDEEGAVIEAHGEVDGATAPRLGTILRAMSMQPEASVVLDLRSTTHLAHAGIEAVMTARRECEVHPSLFEVQVCAGSQPDAVLRTAGAHRHFSVVVWTDSSDCSHSDGALVQTNGMELRIPACKFQVCRVRRLVEEVMLLAGVDDFWLADFVTAIGEAVANAVTHGSPHGGSPYVIFRLKPGPLVATAEIEDFGPGIPGWSGHPVMPPTDSIRGRGLSMMEILADRMEVETGASGTSVRIHKYHGLGVHPEGVS